MILEGEDSVREGKGRSEVHFCSSTITPTVTRDEQFRALQDRGGKGERGKGGERRDQEGMGLVTSLEAELFATNLTG